MPEQESRLDCIVNFTDDDIVSSLLLDRKTLKPLKVTTTSVNNATVDIYNDLKYSFDPVKENAISYELKGSIKIPVYPEDQSRHDVLINEKEIEEDIRKALKESFEVSLMDGIFSYSVVSKDVIKQKANELIGEFDISFEYDIDDAMFDVKEYVGGVVELDYVAKISSKNSTLCYDTVMVAIEEMESEYLLDFEINGKTNNPNYSMVKDREGNVIPNLLLLNQTERLMKEKAVDGVLTGEALKDSLVELSNKLNLNTKAIVGSLKDEAFTNSSHLQSYIEDKAVLDMMKIKESPAPSPALDNKLEKPNGFTIR
jgi:hypothetical protein